MCSVASSSQASAKEGSGSAQPDSLSASLKSPHSRAHRLAREQVVQVGIAVVRRCGARRHLAQHRHLERADHGVGDIVLYLEDIIELAVVGLRPHPGVIVYVDEFGGDAQLLAGLAHAPLKHVRHVEGLADLRERRLLALEIERGGARRHPQARHLAQKVDELLRQTVGEILLVLLLRQVLERQHGNGLLRRRAGRCVGDCLRRGHTGGGRRPLQPAGVPGEKAADEDHRRRADEREGRVRTCRR